MIASNIYKTSGTVSSTEDLPIQYDLYTPSVHHREILPIIIFLHGFKGFKDWGPFPDACIELSSAGFAVLAMNFSLNGIGENPEHFDRLDLFERETLSQDLHDVGSVIEAIKNGEIRSSRGELDTDHIGIIGHSRGGHTAVTASAEYLEIQCLATWSAVADYRTRYTDSMLKDWERKGYTEIKNTRTDQMMRVGKSVYEDAIQNMNQVIAINRVRELHIPVLFIAGKDDETVPFKDSQELFRACPSDTKEIRLIPDTGHTYDSAHPFEDQDFSEKFIEVLDFTESWFLENLG